MYINKSAVHNIVTKFYVRNYGRNSRNSSDRLRQKAVHFRFLHSVQNICYVFMLIAVETIPQTYTFHFWTQGCQKKERKPTPLSLYLIILFSWSSSITSHHETISVQIVIVYYLLYNIIFYVYVYYKSHDSVQGPFWLLTQA